MANLSFSFIPAYIAFAIGLITSLFLSVSATLASRAQKPLKINSDESFKRLCRPRAVVTESLFMGVQGPIQVPYCSQLDNDLKELPKEG